jgi:hypothetical protein
VGKIYFSYITVKSSIDFRSCCVSKGLNYVKKRAIPFSASYYISSEFSYFKTQAVLTTQQMQSKANAENLSKPKGISKNKIMASVLNQRQLKFKSASIGKHK